MLRVGLGVPNRPALIRWGNFNRIAGLGIVVFSLRLAFSSQSLYIAV